MLSLGPRGLRVSRCDPGTQNVAPESGPTSTIYLFHVKRMLFANEQVFNYHMGATNGQAQQTTFMHGSLVGTKLYHTMLRLMHTSGNGWRMGPPCASAPRSLKSCGLSFDSVNTAGRGRRQKDDGRPNAILLAHQSVCHSRPCGPRFSFGPTSKPPSP